MSEENVGVVRRCIDQYGDPRVTCKDSLPGASRISMWPTFRICAPRRVMHSVRAPLHHANQPVADPCSGEDGGNCP